MLSDKSYDLIIELSEGFLNRTLETVYRQEIIPNNLRGSYILDLPKLFSDYRNINYIIHITEPPLIDALAKDRLQLKFKAEVTLLTKLTGIIVKVRGYIVTDPVYNRGKHILELNVKEFKLEEVLVSDNIRLPFLVSDWIENTIKEMLQEEMNLSHIPLSPVIGDITLPEMPEGRIYQIPLGIGKTEILNEETLALGFDIFAKGEGEKTSLNDFSRGNDFAVAISQSAVNKTINHWWEHTTHPKSEAFAGKLRIDNIEKLIEYISEFSIELYPKLATLGFVEIEWDFIDVWLEYEGSLSFSRPSVVLQDGYVEVDGEAYLDLTGHLVVELDVGLEFDTSGPIPDFLTPWKDDRTVSKSRRTFELMRFNKRRVSLDLVDVDASVELDSESRVLIEVHRFDIDLKINWSLPRRLNRALERRLEKKINTSFPMVPISPSIINHQIEGTTLFLDLDIVKIIHRKGELVIHSDIKYR